tara:strand:+ start:159 stop:458 length:300 start_codon:yes stop_codon:yes gene_type:complete
MKFFIISTFSFLLSAEITSIYKINGMMCSQSCPKIVYDSIININGINSCKVDFKNETATITYNDELIKSDRIKKIISKETYFKIEENTGSFSLWNWLFK